MARKSRKNKVQAAAPKKSKLYKTAIYVRLSHEDERKIENESVENQLEFLKDYVLREVTLGEPIEYVDRDNTGTVFNRPAFNRMIADVLEGKINCVVVKDLSRFGRNHLEAADYLERLFPTYGVRFIAVTDHYDSLTSTPTEDGLEIPLKNLMNETYAKDISKKVASSYESKFKAGIYTASMIPYGYTRVENDSSALAVDEKARPVVERIFNEYASGKSMVGIAKDLNAEGILSPTQHFIETGARKSSTFSDSRWMVKSLRQILQNPVYIGDVEMGKERRMLYKGIRVKKMDKEDRYYVNNHHEAIISRQIFETAQERLEETNAAYHKRNENPVEEKNNREPMLKGILFCGDCKHPMYMRRRTRKLKNGYGHYSHYTCSRSGVYENDPKKYWNADKAEEAVATIIRSQIAVFANAANHMKVVNNKPAAINNRKTIERDISSAEKRKERVIEIMQAMYGDFTDGVLSETDYLDIKKSYVEELAEIEEYLEKSRAEIKEYQTTYSGDTGMTEAFRKYEYFEKLTPDIVKSFIKKIYYYSDDRIEVEFNYQDELEALIRIADTREKAS